MKKFIIPIFITLLLILSGCEESALNYKNAVVIDKEKTSTSIYDNYRLRLRHYNSNTKSYRLNWVIVPEFEYNNYNVGDTIR